MATGLEGRIATGLEGRIATGFCIVITLILKRYITIKITMYVFVCYMSMEIIIKVKLLLNHFQLLNALCVRKYCS